jgi:hypothetical protein
MQYIKNFRKCIEIKTIKINVSFARWKTKQKWSDISKIEKKNVLLKLSIPNFDSTNPETEAFLLNYDVIFFTRTNVFCMFT